MNNVVTFFCSTKRERRSNSDRKVIFKTLYFGVHFINPFCFLISLVIDLQHEHNPNISSDNLAIMKFPQQRFFTSFLTVVENDGFQTKIFKNL